MLTLHDLLTLRPKKYGICNRVPTFSTLPDLLTLRTCHWCCQCYVICQSATLKNPCCRIHNARNLLMLRNLLTLCTRHRRLTAKQVVSTYSAGTVSYVRSKSVIQFFLCCAVFMCHFLPALGQVFLCASVGASVSVCYLLPALGQVQ